MKYKLIILISIILILFCSCDSNDENYNTIINKSISPDKKHVAYYFSRDLGATTSKSYQLSVYAFETDLGNKIGNIFVSLKPFSFEWINSNEILIMYKDSSEVYKKANEYNGIKIQYNKKS